jgi:uncharacterized protein (DUF1778 family)
MRAVTLQHTNMTDFILRSAVREAARIIRADE